MQGIMVVACKVLKMSRVRVLYAYNYHDSLHTNHRGGDQELVNEETKLCYFGHICQENSTPIFLWSVPANSYSQMYTMHLSLNSSEIIKFTCKYTSNTGNLIKMIFTWHNTSNNSNNCNEVETLPQKILNCKITKSHKNNCILFLRKSNVQLMGNKICKPSVLTHVKASEYLSSSIIYTPLDLHRRH